MERTGTVLKKDVIRMVLAVLLPLCLLASGCTLFKSSSDNSVTTTEKTIWHSREQNVRIVRQDTARGAGFSQNDHPILLEPGQVRSALASLEVTLQPGSKPVPVFTKPELDSLTDKLGQALAEAGPGQDVTFVVIGDRKALYGLAKQRKVTTGRVFYRDGKLNIIFGRVVDEIKEHTDPRLEPMEPGSRSRAVSHEWVLEEEPDMQFYAGGDMIRNDWVMLDLAAMAAHEALGIKPAKTGRVAAETPATVPQRVRTPQETGPAQAPVYQVPAVGQIPQAGKASKTIEERLLMLNDLKKKNLITDEEYKKKRADILNDL